MHDDLNRQTPIKERDYFSYTFDSKGKIAKRVQGSVSLESPFGRTDEIQASFPMVNQTLYTYLLNSVELGTLLVTYRSSCKKVFLRSQLNEL